MLSVSPKMKQINESYLQVASNSSDFFFYTMVTVLSSEQAFSTQSLDWTRRDSDFCSCVCLWWCLSSATKMACNYSSFVHLSKAAKFIFELQETIGWLLLPPVTGWARYWWSADMPRRQEARACTLHIPDIPPSVNTKVSVYKQMYMHKDLTTGAIHKHLNGSLGTCWWQTLIWR